MMSDMPQQKCCLCGHPDFRHRLVDVVLERVATGEGLARVLYDYEMGERRFVEVALGVMAAGQTEEPKEG